MSMFEDLAQRYIDTWNETDPTARRAAVDQLYSEDARYVDPLAVAEGREAIAATIGAVQGQFPGFVFRLAGPVDAHHDPGPLRLGTWPGWPGGPDRRVRRRRHRCLRPDPDGARVPRQGPYRRLTTAQRAGRPSENERTASRLLSPAPLANRKDTRLASDDSARADHVFDTDTRVSPTGVARRFHTHSRHARKRSEL